MDKYKPYFIFAKIIYEKETNWKLVRIAYSYFCEEKNPHNFKVLWNKSFRVNFYAVKIIACLFNGNFFKESFKSFEYFMRREVHFSYSGVSCKKWQNYLIAESPKFIVIPQAR
jgi:hypothetical protein